MEGVGRVPTRHTYTTTQKDTAMNMRTPNCEVRLYMTPDPYRLGKESWTPVQWDECFANARHLYKRQLYIDPGYSGTELGKWITGYFGIELDMHSGNGMADLLYSSTNTGVFVHVMWDDDVSSS